MSNTNSSHRHAYLIIANDNFPLLCQLLRLLDDPRNDIFLLIDQKSQHVPMFDLKESIQKSTLYIHPQPIPIFWGDYSLIEAELLLLKLAVSTSSYSYYHLLSGKCIPIKSQDYIHDFFAKNDGTEFVSIDKVDPMKYRFRYQFYFSFIRKLKSPKSIAGKAITYGLVLLQRIIGVDRVKGIDIEFKKGANWFSITHKFAEYILSKEDWIRKIFHDTYCCDELFLQTLLYNSEFYKNVNRNPHGEHNMRYTDWQRGNPYTFCLSDADELRQSKQLFARKFDDHTTAAAIYQLCVSDETKQVSSTDA